MPTVTLRVGPKGKGVMYIGAIHVALHSLHPTSESFEPGHLGKLPGSVCTQRVSLQNMLTSMHEFHMHVQSIALQHWLAEC